MDKLFLSVSDTAHALSLGRTKIYELINAGRLDIVKIGRRTLVRASSVQEIADDRGSCRVPGAEQ